MSSKLLTITPDLHRYMLDVSLRDSPLLARLRQETAARSDSSMQISPEQGQFMALLVKLIGAKHCIEIGTYTGYSALVVALALPEDGKILCSDINPDTTSIGRNYWREAGVESKIDLRLAPATDTLESLLKAEQAGQYDFVFIDADKENYDSYYEACLKLVRRGGLIAFDNVLWGGAVADPTNTSASTEAIRALNLKLRDDKRIDCSLVPIGDGLTLAMKL